MELRFSSIKVFILAVSVGTGILIIERVDLGEVNVGCPRNREMKILV